MLASDEFPAPKLSSQALELEHSGRGGGDSRGAKDSQNSLTCSGLSLFAGDTEIEEAPAVPAPRCGPANRPAPAFSFTVSQSLTSAEGWAHVRLARELVEFVQAAAPEQRNGLKQLMDAIIQGYLPVMADFSSPGHQCSEGAARLRAAASFHRAWAGAAWGPPEEASLGPLDLDLLSQRAPHGCPEDDGLAFARFNQRRAIERRRTLDLLELMCPVSYRCAAVSACVQAMRQFLDEQHVEASLQAINVLLVPPRRAHLEAVPASALPARPARQLLPLLLGLFVRNDLGQYVWPCLAGVTVAEFAGRTLENNLLAFQRTAESGELDTSREAELLLRLLSFFGSGPACGGLVFGYQANGDVQDVSALRDSALCRELGRVQAGVAWWLRQSR